MGRAPLWFFLLASLSLFILFACSFIFFFAFLSFFSGFFLFVVLTYRWWSYSVFCFFSSPPLTSYPFLANTSRRHPSILPASGAEEYISITTAAAMMTLKWHTQTHSCCNIANYTHTHTHTHTHSWPMTLVPRSVKVFRAVDIHMPLGPSLGCCGSWRLNQVPSSTVTWARSWMLTASVFMPCQWIQWIEWFEIQFIRYKISEMSGPGMLFNLEPSGLVQFA